jgi:putative ABC transport system ATP-binding protein
LTGPSGSGKTTLLTLVGGLRAVQQGSCVVLGEQLQGASEQQRIALRRRIGFVFQEHNLLGFLTAAQNVAMSLEPDMATTERERRARSAVMLNAVGLGEFQHALPSHLSGGQRQRVAVARALVRDPDLLIADEPTASLDGRTGRELVDLLSRLARERNLAVLMVTHDPRIIDIADRILALEDGEIRACVSRSNSDGDLLGLVHS